MRIYYTKSTFNDALWASKGGAKQILHFHRFHLAGAKQILHFHRFDLAGAKQILHFHRFDLGGAK